MPVDSCHIYRQRLVVAQTCEPKIVDWADITNFFEAKSTKLGALGEA